MLMKKRGQAAMEFLMTYGWAILAAIIVVGVLWYIIGSPGNLAGEQFKVSQPFSANAMSFDGANLRLEFVNGVGSTIDVKGLTFETGKGIKCSNITVSTVDITDGSKTVQNATCTYGSGERINSEFTLNYLESGSSLTQRATGSLNAQAP